MRAEGGLEGGQVTQYLMPSIGFVGVIAESTKHQMVMMPILKFVDTSNVRISRIHKLFLFCEKNKSKHYYKNTIEFFFALDIFW